MSYETYLKTHYIDCEAEVAAGNGVWTVCRVCMGSGRVYECGACEDGHGCYGCAGAGRWFKYNEELAGDELVANKRGGEK